MLSKLKKEKLKYYLSFLATLTVKETKLRYKKTYLGFFWIVLAPLSQMIVVGFVFSFFIKIENYFHFLFLSLITWNFFQASLIRSTSSIVSERLILHKSKFPIEAIPISTVFSNFIHLFVAMFLYFILLSVTNGLIFPQVFIVLPILIWLLFFTVGLSLLLSSLNVTLRDLSFAVQTGLTLWFYGTPVIYNLSLIPENFRFLFFINPLTFIFESLRWAVMGQGTLNTNMLLCNLFISILISALGVYVFIKKSPYFVDHL